MTDLRLGRVARGVANSLWWCGVPVAASSVAETQDPGSSDGRLFFILCLEVLLFGRRMHVNRFLYTGTSC